MTVHFLHPARLKHFYQAALIPERRNRNQDADVFAPWRLLESKQVAIVDGHVEW